MKKQIVAACLLMMQTASWGKVVLPEILSDNMVLQQQTEVKLWGKAKANAQVSIRPSWDNRTYARSEAPHRRRAHSGQHL